MHSRQTMRTTKGKDLRAQIDQLRQMTVPELRRWHLETFGEEATSCHRQFLFWQIARRLQSASTPPLSEEARLTATTRERVSQVMKMMRLAPDIQDEILRLPPMRRRQRAITVPEVTAIAEEIVWDDQRESWRKLKQQNGLSEG